MRCHQGKTDLCSCVCSCWYMSFMMCLYRLTTWMHAQDRRQAILGRLYCHWHSLETISPIEIAAEKYISPMRFLGIGFRVVETLVALGPRISLRTT